MKLHAAWILQGDLKCHACWGRMTFESVFSWENSRRRFHEVLLVLGLLLLFSNGASVPAKKEFCPREIVGECFLLRKDLEKFILISLPTNVVDNCERSFVPASIWVLLETFSEVKMNLYLNCC